jgi:hypothetical protein
MNGENKAHMKHVKIPPKEKTNHPPKTSWSKQKPDQNNLFKYNKNTNEATRRKWTMLTCPSNLEQFDQRISKKHA